MSGWDQVGPGQGCTVGLGQVKASTCELFSRARAFKYTHGTYERGLTLFAETFSDRRGGSSND